MQLIVLTGIIVLMLGLISFNSQVSIAKHTSTNEDKKTDSVGNSNTQTDKPKTEVTPSDSTATTTSDIIPIGPTVQKPICKPDDKSCAAIQIPCDTNCAIKNGVTATLARMVPTTPPPQTTNTDIALENQRVIDNLNAASQTSDTSGSSGGSSSSSSDEQSTDEEKNNFSDKNLGAADSRFILIAQDGKIDLFSIQSDEKELDTGILPKLIHPVESFDNTADAISWINQYDNRSN